MNTATRLTTDDRNRAIARLRTLTTGTAIASVAAVAGFGLLAALTNPGHAATIASSGTSALTTGSTDDGTMSLAGGNTDGAGNAGATATPTPNPNFGISTTPLINVAGPAHVSTGGS